MSTAFAPLPEAPEAGAAPDPLRAAVDRLRATLPAGTDARVIVDFLEDELREGLSTIAELEAHYLSVVEALGRERISPIALLNAGDDLRVLDQLDYLTVVTNQLRRRLAQVAGRLRDARAVTT